ncbi:MAG: hypothetical protein JWM82_867 [Myxococcales bacterium]|nr:hypothetical protein [Myxococcales bacterium]
MNASLGALAAWLICNVSEGSAAPSPQTLLGTWDVVHVAVDKQDTIHQTYIEDDPELMVGSLVVDSESTHLNVGKLGCRQAPRPIHFTTWRDLFARAFPRPPGGGRSPVATPKDFGIDVPEAGKTTAFTLCASPSERFPKGAWAVLKERDLMLLRADPQVLFLLRRRVDRATPVTSFDCRLVADATASTICDSFELAAWDRSVALALAQATRMFPEKAAALNASQARWLRDLKSCGKDASCIAPRLKSRVADLVWERKT